MAVAATPPDTPATECSICRTPLSEDMDEGGTYENAHYVMSCCGSAVHLYCVVQVTTRRESNGRCGKCQTAISGQAVTGIAAAARQVKVVVSARRKELSAAIGTLEERV